MTEHPLAIANYFVGKALASGENLTPMKLLKLVYLAHGWHLGLTGEPLISEAVEAWKYGPVIPSVYRAFKRFGSGNITCAASVFRGGQMVIPALGDKSKESLLNAVWTGYLKFTGPQLSTLTHQPDTAWYEVWHKQKGCNEESAVIPNNLIAEYYRKQAAAN